MSMEFCVLCQLEIRVAYTLGLVRRASQSHIYTDIHAAFFAEISSNIRSCMVRIRFSSSLLTCLGLAITIYIHRI
jgi:hypothetical protein